MRSLWCLLLGCLLFLHLTAADRCGCELVMRYLNTERVPHQPSALSLPAGTPPDDTPSAPLKAFATKSIGQMLHKLRSETFKLHSKVKSERDRITTARAYGANYKRRIGGNFTTAQPITEELGADWLERSAANPAQIRTGDQQRMSDQRMLQKRGSYHVIRDYEGRHVISADWQRLQKSVSEWA